MGKKSREKRERKEAGAPSKKNKPGLEPRLPVDPTVWEKLGSGDLRLVEAHVEKYLQGKREAETALTILGRDASAQVMEIAERLGNEKLLEFGRRLVALKPKLETNMLELRRDSIVELLEAENEKAPALGEGPAVTVKGGAVAVFDPLRVADALVKGGRPRADIARIGQGDLLWVAVGEADARTEVTLSEGEGPSGALVLRLQVDSGVVFVGPPEASDGPRLGSVRLHPSRTALDDHRAEGHFIRVPPGRYAVRVQRENGTLRLFVSPTPEEAPLTLSLAQLMLAPVEQ